MSSARIAHGSLCRYGADLLPADLEGIDFLLLDGGPLAAPSETGPESLLEEAIRRLAPQLYLNAELTVVATLAGRDPAAVAARLAAPLGEAGSPDLAVGVVQGSDIIDRLEEFLAAGEPLRHTATGQAFTELCDPTVAAAALLGPDALRAALGQSARVVLVGAASAEGILHACGAAGASDGPATPVSLKHRTGYCGAALLRIGDTSHNEFAGPYLDAWGDALRNVDLDPAGATVVWRPDADGPPTGGAIVRYRHPDKPSAGQGLRVALAAFSRLAAGGDAIDPTLPPTVVAEHALWPTEVATDLVEWSVDVRPAKDWVE